MLQFNEFKWDIEKISIIIQSREIFNILTGLEGIFKCVLDRALTFPYKGVIMNIFELLKYFLSQTGNRKIQYYCTY